MNQKLMSKIKNWLNVTATNADKKQQIAESEERAILEILIAIEQEEEAMLHKDQDSLEQLWRGPAYNKKIDITEVLKQRIGTDG
jgi:hypothetical protein